VGIVASSMKIPVISIPWHSKVTRYYGQIGKKEFCLFNKNYTKEILSDLIEKAIFCTQGYYIPDKVIQRSILNNDLLQKFLFRF
jgi:hypothetical protein